ncbi:uncharacterized protein LOC120357976 [Solenopsis invicta]|nr:uncharacterized protein LOC120357976 [Solenopsis invicta]
MGSGKKRKHSRSRSRDRHRNRDRSDERLQKMQIQLDNLTSQLQILSQAQIPTHQEIRGEEKEGNKENVPNLANKAIELGADTPTPNDISTVPKEMLDILGEDPSSTKEITVDFHPELKIRWEKWLREGFPDDDKKPILEKYPRKGELLVEAPKVNLEIVPVMTDIAKKRDGHFIDTQNTVGSALSALGATISMILNEPEDGIDSETLITYLCDAGKLMTDVFHKHSVARRSFITPLLSKSVKPTIDATKPNEWLYGTKFAEQVKEAKTIEKACTNIKAPDKSSKIFDKKPKYQENFKTPSAKYKQVGQYQRHPTIRFRSRNTQSNQRTSKTSSRSKSQTSTKK